MKKSTTTTMFEGKEVIVETVDCSPTWSGMLSVLLELQANGTTAESRKVARGELARMAKIADEYNKLAKEQEDKITISWSIVDVHGRNVDMEDRDMTDEDAREILRGVEANHDCNFGITWEHIDNGIREWYNGQDSKDQNTITFSIN